MKTNARLVILICSFFMLFPLHAGGSREKTARENELVVYAYDSFTADWGPGPEIVRLFEEETGLKLTLISVGDSGQVFTRAVLEKKAPRADVLIGIDNQNTERAVSAGILMPYKPANADKFVPKNLIMDSEWHVTPYDWSYFAMIFNSDSGLPAPESLADLTKPIYEKKIILMDPRTSTPGLGFVAWTKAVYGDTYLDYWKALKPNILTMAPGWDTGYGLFTSGEAALVVSYTTSAAYHVECDNIDKFKALIFPEGHTMQIEGAGIVQGAANVEGAKKFMDFLISLKAQEVMPTTQWMYPVNPETVLPTSYDAAPLAKKSLKVAPGELQKAANEVLELLAR